MDNNEDNAPAPESLIHINGFLQTLPLNPNNTCDCLEHLKALRNLCAVHPSHQSSIAEHDVFNNQLHNILFESGTAASDTIPQNIRTVALQLLANCIVQNTNAQRRIWQRHGAAIVQQAGTSALGRHTNIFLAIVYNVLKGGGSADGGSKSVFPVFHMERQALTAAVRVWQRILTERCTETFEFLDFLFEHFLVHGGQQTVRCYAHLTATERISFLEYLVNYLRMDSPNGGVHRFLLKYINKEFNVKSDRILVCKPDGSSNRTAAEFQNGAQQDDRRIESASAVTDCLPAREAYALLRVIASASGRDLYGPFYADEQSLFINVSSLLRCLAQLGQQSQNIFTPLTRLEEVAPASATVPQNFEWEVSFELKTLLMRCVANLLYKNPSNQGYCLDTQLLPTLLECTNMDARNPLLKEWSILAIRNACYGCPEIQAVIANMTNQGHAQNDIISELNLDMGALRIKPTIE